MDDSTPDDTGSFAPADLGMLGPPTHQRRRVALMNCLEKPLTEPEQMTRICFAARPKAPGRVNGGLRRPPRRTGDRPGIHPTNRSKDLKKGREKGLTWTGEWDKMKVPPAGDPPRSLLRRGRRRDREPARGMRGQKKVSRKGHEGMSRQRGMAEGERSGGRSRERPGKDHGETRGEDAEGGGPERTGTLTTGERQV